MNRRGISSTSLLVAAAGLAVASHAPAAILNWASAVTGTASTAARWSPAQIPTSADDLTFNATAGTQAYTVTFDATTATSRSMTFNQDNVSVTTTASHTTVGTVVIGNVVAQTGNVILTSGTWNAAGFQVGQLAGATGSLSATGSAADVIVSGTGVSAISIGTNGTGTLGISSGGLVQCAGSLLAGSASGAVGNLNISGAIAAVGGARSTLDINGAGTTTIGLQGDSTVTIANGALTSIAGTLRLADRSTSTVNMNIGGAGGLASLLDATLDVAGDMHMADFTGGAGGGTATATVNANGRLIVGGILQLGTGTNNGTATLNINSGADVTVGSVHEGNFGTLNHNGGTLRINGGTHTAFVAPLTVSAPAANNATLIFQNNAAQTLSPSGGVSLKLGTGTGTGSLRVESGADLDAGNGDINLGDGNGSTGNATVTGAGSRLIANSVNSDIRVGFNGDGNLSVDSGGQCLFKNLLVPNPTATGAGFVDAIDNTTNITTQFLSVGQGSGSTGTVQMQTGSALVVSDPGFSTNVRATGMLTIGSGATFSTPGTVSINAGGLFLVGGSVSGAGLVDVSGDLYSNTNNSATPIVDVRTVIRSGGVLELNVEDLTIGKSTSTTGFDAQDGSVINVGAHTLTLVDADRATVDTVTINGGTIVAPNGLEIVTPVANGTLDGTGTITTSELFMESGGSVITATTANGITINGKFRNNSGMIDGTKYTFNNNPAISDSGWTGAGTINAQVVFNSGTTISALANMIMGDGSTLGATFNAGSIAHLHTRNLTLNDSNGVGLPTLFDMNGGTITSNNGLVVNNGRTLRGNGFINCPAAGLTMFGTIDPAEDNNLDSIYSGLGTFRVGTTYTHGVNAHFRCDLAGFNNEFQPLNDRITCTGAVTLDGVLDVFLINGYVPTQCDTFTIVSGSSVTGTFRIVNKPHNVSVVYNPTNVQLLVSGCVADVDDGSFTGTPDCGVTIDDLLYYLSIFEAGTLDADVDDGSFTGTHDDGVTIDDLLYYLFRFEAGC